MVRSSVMGIVLLISPWLELHAQPIGFRHLTTEDGLSDDRIQCSMQDSRGFMWIGTAGGLNRFDGLAFTVYRHDPDQSRTLLDNCVWSVFEDSDGFLWVGTSNGLNRFDPATEEWLAFQHDSANTYSLSHNEVRAICEDDRGNVWVGTRDGLNRLERAAGVFTRYRNDPRDSGSVSHNFISVLFRDSRGVLWVGTGDYSVLGGGGLNRYNPGPESFTRYPFASPPGSWGFKDWVTAIYEDRSGMVWIGTDCGLHVYDHTSGTFHSYYPRPLVNYVKAIVEDRQGNLWIGSWQNGIDILQKSTGKFLRLTHIPSDTKSLSHSSVTSLCRTSDRTGGVLWVGTSGGINTTWPSQGLFKTYRQEARRISSARASGARTDFMSTVSQLTGQRQTRLNNVRSVFEDPLGNLWVGTEWELARLDRTVEPPRWKTVPESGPWPSVWAITGGRGGCLWVTTMSHLLELDPSSGRYRAYIQGGSSTIDTSRLWGENMGINCLYVDRSGCLLIGSMGGLGILDRERKKFTRFTHSPSDVTSISHNDVRTILEDQREVVWVGTLEGLNVLDRRTGKFSRFIHDVRDSTSLISNEILALHEDHKGELWVGTGGGLDRFDRASGAFRHLTEKNGLPARMVRGILGDARGHLWLSSDRGVSRYDPERGSITNYLRSHGVEGVPFNGGASFKNRKGEMFFGGMNGLTVFQPDSMTDDFYEPPLVITAFRKLNDRAELVPAPLGKGEITLSPSENVFSVEFAALDFVDAGTTRYAYMLEGFDREWVYCGKERHATYTNLDPGAYVFRVRGSRHDGAWNRAGLSIGIVIHPPYWRTWWFRTFVVILVGLLLYAAYRYRLSRLMAMEKLRLRIAQDLHDDIGSALGGIALTSEQLAGRLSGDAEARSDLERLKEVAIEKAEGLRDLVWTINPRRDTSGDLVVYLKETAHRMLTGMDVQFTGRQEGEKMTLEVKHNVTMMFREVVHNILRHSRARRVEISVTEAGGVLRLRVADDGVGFDAGTCVRGNGLQNLEQRARMIGGTLQVRSSPGAGTSVDLEVKIT